MLPGLTAELATSFATIALSHVTREFPAKMDHVLTGPADIQGPRALHPMFYGSFDWHSCVHGFWLLATIYRRFPLVPRSADIRALFDAHFTADKVAGELAYLERPMQGHFERPYGWAWLLALAAELSRHSTSEGRTWSNELEPLARSFAQRFRSYWPKLPYPIRAGTHGNTAFAATLAIEYAEACGDPQLLDITRGCMRTLFGQDTDCRALEPSGNEFLSPILTEIECMRRALPPAQFSPWLNRFLPNLADGEPRALLQPIDVPDRADPQIVHLDGLNLSRAWCWRMLATALPSGDRRKQLALEAAQAHLDQSLPHLADDYMGEHWLATFAMLALAQ